MALLDDIQAMRQTALDALQQVETPEALEAWRIRYVGSKGAVKDVMSGLKEAPREDKPALGKACNALKQALQGAFDARAAEIASARSGPAGPLLDVTLPGRRPGIGHLHVTTQTINEICEIFTRMGFSVAYGPEVEDERHNFVALNIPASHPARDPLDNFYIDEATMLRSQTSTVQIRVMENTSPPVRIIAPGRVYRPDTVDATHSFMFHQVEGLYVDEGVTLADLKSDLAIFCRGYFGPEVRTRFRPSFFPFTEPSGEVDLLFHHADGSTEWIELGGCGMVDPNVLEAVGYDAEKYTGYAFGLGVDRIAMMMAGIDDIRLFLENDLRFLDQV